ncbi:MAG: RIP metalloprotease RseP, partial [Betaproteobacteria bacterium]|nr:RIP metalloprotease RseP [Betaproteobacteria bacterium]
MHTVLSFIVALSVLIVVHEYGHYLAARLCKVRVLRFSVGFGRPLATWRLGRDATEWSIAAIP